MINANDLANAFARNATIVKSQTAGLTQADSLLQFPFRGNCLNWVLGHIVANRDSVLETLGEPPSLGAAGARYKRGTEPEAGDEEGLLTRRALLLSIKAKLEPVAGDEEGLLTLGELLAHLERAQERIAAALSRMDENALAREVTIAERKATVGQRAFFLYFHETYHVGQTEIFRQLAGKDDKVI
jgi:DinB superfamily